MIKSTEKKVYGYTRVSSETQKNEPQINEISKYAVSNKMIIEKIFETKVSSRKDRKFRLIDETINVMDNGDTLLVYALDRLGRSTIETLSIIEDIKNKGIKLILIKDNLIIDSNDTNPMNKMLLTMLSGFAELERNYISERTKAGLEARKKEGVILGRKLGSIGKTMYDDYEDKIKELALLGLSLPKIISFIGVGKVGSLRKFIISRKILD